MTVSNESHMHLVQLLTDRLVLLLVLLVLLPRLLLRPS
jgi:hypothetical protein